MCVQLSCVAANKPAAAFAHGSSGLGVIRHTGDLEQGEQTSNQADWSVGSIVDWGDYSGDYSASVELHYRAMLSEDKDDYA